MKRVEDCDLRRMRRGILVLRPSLRSLLDALDAGKLDSEGKAVSEALASYKTKALWTATKPRVTTCATLAITLAAGSSHSLGL